jgi:hypothetical protein
MSAESRNSVGRTFLLIILGVVAFLAGVKSLVILIPVAMLVWFGVPPALRSGRN